MIDVIQSCRRRNQRQAVDVERLADPIQQIGNLRMGNRIPYPQSRQSIRLGKSASDYQIRKAVEPVQSAATIHLRFDIFDIGFIHHHDHLRGNGLQQAQQLRRLQPSTGWIVGIGDEYDSGTVIDRRQDCRRVVTIRHGVIRRISLGNPRTGTHSLGNDGIDGKGMLGIDRFVFWGQKGACH